MEQHQWLSACCTLPIHLRRQNSKGGDFLCTGCKNQCIAIKAESHCCRAAVIIPPDLFPFVCSACDGSCELADPESPTPDQQVGADVKSICWKIRSGEMNPLEAWTELIAIIDREKECVYEDAVRCIQFSMEEELAHPPAKGVPAAEAFLGGVDASLAVLDNIINELLPDSEK